jgi:hypothetical protein
VITVVSVSARVRVQQDRAIRGFETLGAAVTLTASPNGNASG